MLSYISPNTLRSVFTSKSTFYVCFMFTTIYCMSKVPKNTIKTTTLLYTIHNYNNLTYKKRLFMNKINYLIMYAFISTTIISAISDGANIFQEARENNAEAIRQRLNNSEDLSAKDANGNNILHIA